MEIKCQGYVGYKIKKLDGTIVLSVDPYKQLIVSVGLDWIATNSTILTVSDFCRVGTGVTAPASNQTGLVSQVGVSSAAAVNLSGTNSGVSPWWHASTRDYQFAAGTVDGVALSELGFFNFSTGGVMFSRLLFRDGIGDPTTITLLADEILEVSYEIRTYVPTGDVLGSFNLDIDGTPTNFDYTLRASFANESNRWGPGSAKHIVSTAFEFFSTDVLGTEEAGITGTSDIMTDTVTASYVAGDHFSGIGCNVGINDANFVGGIGGLALRNNAGNPLFQVSFSPKIPKDNTQEITLGTDFFIFSWAAGEP